MWKSLVVGLVAIPVLGLFLGIGFLAYTIGQHWDARSTDSLITGLVATCGGGAVVIGVLLALIVGVPLALRTYGEAGRARREWREEYPAPSPQWPRPMIDNETKPLPPPWGVTGGGQFQLLTDSQQQRYTLDRPTEQK